MIDYEAKCKKAEEKIQVLIAAYEAIHFLYMSLSEDYKVLEEELREMKKNFSKLEV